MQSARRRSSSGKASSRKETYKTAEIGLDKDQRQAFKSFYEQKKPKNQNDQILTLMVWLKDNAGLEPVNADHLYTGFRTVGAKVSGKTSSVLGNIVGTGAITSVGNGLYQLTHVGEDEVEYELPREEKKGK